MEQNLYAQSSTEAQSVLRFLDFVFPRPRKFSIRLWDGAFLPSDEPSSLVVTFRTPGALRKMFSIPLELNIGEAYGRGDVEVEGEPFALLHALKVISDSGLFTSVGYIDPETANPFTITRLFGLLRRWMALPSDPPPGENTVAFRPPHAEVHSQERDRLAVQYHYDFGNEFYTLWLGYWMMYSCNYYTTGTETLDSAQDQKLEHICRKLRLKPTDRLLDIGCGWGGVVTYAAEHYGVSALGITLSNDQYNFATRRIQEKGLSDRVTIKVMDYRDIQGSTFDKVVSLEMCEHVGRHNLPIFFQQAYKMLKPGGLFLNQATCTLLDQYEPSSPLQSVFEKYVLGRGTFNARYIFPDSDSLPMTQMNYLAQKVGFEIYDVENLRRHYDLTLSDWIRSLEAHREPVVALIGEMRYRVYLVYLYSYLAAFQAGTLDNYQTLMARPGATTDIPMAPADLFS